MTVDGCRYSFDELTQTVLPQYMTALRSRMEQPHPMSVFLELGVGPVALARRFGYHRDPSGCYVLIDQVKPIYVGISRRLLERVQQHVRKGDHYTATLAYRIAFYRKRHRTTAREAMQDPSFRREFDAAQHYLRSLSVAFIEIENPVELYIFEAYCAMELRTGLDSGGWNTFVTH